MWVMHYLDSVPFWADHDGVLLYFSFYRKARRLTPGNEKIWRFSEINLVQVCKIRDVHPKNPQPSLISPFHDRWKESILRELWYIS